MTVIHKISEGGIIHIHVLIKGPGELKPLRNEYMAWTRSYPPLISLYYITLQCNILRDQWFIEVIIKAWFIYAVFRHAKLNLKILNRKIATKKFTLKILSLSIILNLFLYFCKSEPEYSYKLYSYIKKKSVFEEIWYSFF